MSFLLIREHIYSLILKLNEIKLDQENSRSRKVYENVYWKADGNGSNEIWNGNGMKNSW